MKKFKGLIGIGVAVLVCIFTLNILDISFYKKDNKEKLKVLNGYKVNVHVKGLKNPSAMCFDEKGNLYIAENEGDKGKVSVYTTKGEYKEVVKGLSATVGYIKIDKGILYISHKGKVSKYKDSKLTDIVNNLPSFGDHSNNGIAIGYDNMVYIAQGSATNSGVVGLDNYEKGWLRDNPFLHDIPFSGMVLKGENFTTYNPFTEDKKDVALSNGFLPFNTPAKINDNVKGNKISNATIIRANTDGSYVELFATGVRNPKNIINLSDGSILVTVQGMENRGSRPVNNGRDYIYKLTKGQYAGWPDFEGGEYISQDKFKVEGKKQPLPLTYSVKGEIAMPIVTFGESGRVGYMDISKDDDFGFKGQLLVPFKKGDKEDAKILAVNIKDKTTQELLVNLKGEETLKNPSQCVFSPNGGLYILESENGLILNINKDKKSINGLLPSSVPMEYIVLAGIIIISLVIIVFIRSEKGNKTESKNN